MKSGLPCLSFVELTEFWQVLLSIPRSNGWFKRIKLSAGSAPTETRVRARARGLSTPAGPGPLFAILNFISILPPTQLPAAWAEDIWHRVRVRTGVINMVIFGWGPFTPQVNQLPYCINPSAPVSSSARLQGQTLELVTVLWSYPTRFCRLGSWNPPLFSTQGQRKHA